MGRGGGRGLGGDGDGVVTMEGARVRLWWAETSGRGGGVTRGFGGRGGSEVAEGPRGVGRARPHNRIMGY